MDTVDGICGSGKTTLAMNYSASSVERDDAKIIFAQPTTALLGEWQPKINSSHPDCPTVRID